MGHRCCCAPPVPPPSSSLPPSWSWTFSSGTWSSGGPPVYTCGCHYEVNEGEEVHESCDPYIDAVPGAPPFVPETLFLNCTEIDFDESLPASNGCWNLRNAKGGYTLYRNPSSARWQSECIPLGKVCGPACQYQLLAQWVYVCSTSVGGYGVCPLALVTGTTSPSGDPNTPFGCMSVAYAGCVGGCGNSTARLDQFAACIPFYRYERWRFQNIGPPTLFWWEVDIEVYG